MRHNILMLSSLPPWTCPSAIQLQEWCLDMTFHTGSKSICFYILLQESNDISTPPYASDKLSTQCTIRMTLDFNNKTKRINYHRVFRGKWRTHTHTSRHCKTVKLYKSRHNIVAQCVINYSSQNLILFHYDQDYYHV